MGTDLMSTANFPLPRENAGEKEGYLKKQSDFFKSWNQRYCILKGNTIYYFKTDTDKQLKGIISLEHCRTVKGAEDKTNKPWSLEVAVPGQTFFLLADNEAEKNDWIRAIGRSIVQASMRRKEEEEAAMDAAPEPVKDDSDDLASKGSGKKAAVVTVRKDAGKGGGKKDELYGL